MGQKWFQDLGGGARLAALWRTAGSVGTRVRLLATRAPFLACVGAQMKSHSLIACNASRRLNGAAVSSFVYSPKSIAGPLGPCISLKVAEIRSKLVGS